MPKTFFYGANFDYRACRGGSNKNEVLQSVLKSIECGLVRLDGCFKFQMQMGGKGMVACRGRT